MRQHFLPEIVISFKPALTERRYNAPQIPRATTKLESGRLAHRFLNANITV